MKDIKYYFKNNLLKTIEKNKKKYYLYDKSLFILPEYTNHIFYIYTGKIFVKLTIYPEMIGYKFGNFVYTRKKHVYKKKKKINGSKNYTN